MNIIMLFMSYTITDVAHMIEQQNVKLRYAMTHDFSVPIILVALDYKLHNHVPKLTIPFLCANDNRIIILTDTDQHIDAPCVELVYINKPIISWWSKRFPTREKIFFERWYIIRNWMTVSGCRQVFTMDSDAIMTQSINDMIQTNWNTINKHELWLTYDPPRSSWTFVLMKYAALQDILLFWDRMFTLGLWTRFGPRSPNDMIALGHYIHTAVGKPYPCWGYGSEHKVGSCDGSIDYGITETLNALHARNITGAFVPGTLNLNHMGQPEMESGVFDVNWHRNFNGRYAMKQQQMNYNGHNKKWNGKQLRFHDGNPQFLLKTRRWISLYGYIMEDTLETCVHIHLKRIAQRETCVCNNMCCKWCV